MIAFAIVAAVGGVSAAQGQSVVTLGDPNARACHLATLETGPSRRAERQCTDALATGSRRMTARNHAATLVNRGILRQRRGAYDAALADFRDARGYVDDLPQAWIGEGNVAFLQQDFAAALFAYDQALASELAEAHALHFNRGLALERLNRPDEAAQAYRDALALQPDWLAAEARLYRLENPEEY